MYIASYIYCQGKLLYRLYVVQMPLEFEDLLLPPTYCTLQTVCDQNISLGNWCGTLLRTCRQTLRLYTTRTTHCGSSNDHGRSHIVHNNTYRYPVHTCDIWLTSVIFWRLHVAGSAIHE